DGKARGVVFLAYNASIAEQFEVIQRWVAGGNSSGISTSQPDPLLGVPRPGAPTVFRFSAGDQPVRVDLGDQALCTLEWGLYTFVPPMALLKDPDTLPADPGPWPPGSSTAPSSSLPSTTLSTASSPSSSSTTSSIASSSSSPSAGSPTVPVTPEQRRVKEEFE